MWPHTYHDNFFFKQGNKKITNFWFLKAICKTLNSVQILGFCVAFSVLLPLLFLSSWRQIGQCSSTATYPSSAASSSLLGLLKHLPKSTLPCHRGLAAKKLLTLLAVIKSRKAFSPLSCKTFFLLTTDSPKKTLQTQNCCQTTDLTNCNQTNHYSTDKQTN